MQITHVKLLNVVGFSSGFGCVFIASALCFCNISATLTLSSKRSIASILVSGEVCSCSAVVAALPSFLRTRFALGPGVTLWRFRRAGAGSGVVRSTYPFGRRGGRGGDMAVLCVCRTGERGLRSGGEVRWR
jgi:hypothetical protein